jgi:hypothetical protein
MAAKVDMEGAGVAAKVDTAGAGAGTAARVDTAEAPGMVI